MVVVSAAIAGGGGGEQPPPVPDPGPRYEQIPIDLCDRLRVEAVAQQFDLSVPSWYEHMSNYDVAPNHWYEHCGFVALADDGRLSAQLVPFRPGGGVTVRVYHELADAEDGYEQDARGAFEHRAETQEGATTAEVDGWWDSGLTLEWAREVSPDAHAGDDDVSNLVVSQLVRHGNLVVEAYLRAVSPPENAPEAVAFLREVQRALLDAAVEHLSVPAE